MGIQDDIWENSRAKEGVCNNCINAGGEYNHPGFFNFDANILIVEEAPSQGHFNYSCYDRSQNYARYKECYEIEHLDDLFTWDMFTDFLGPIWKPLGFKHEEIFEEIYMTSAVKCPVTKGTTGYEKKKELNSAFESCCAYLENEIEEMKPEVIITAGVHATKGTADILGVPESEQNNLSISTPEWWGVSNFSTQTDPPMLHMPNWFYYTNHHQLTAEEWENCLAAIRDGLQQTVYTE